MIPMTAPLTATDLRALLEHSRLIAADQLQPWFANGDTDPDAIAFRLVAERLLTPFQARQLQKGRADGFFLTEKYKILDYIGAGGMGKVYLCEHLILHRLVAVKLLQLPAGTASDAARSFERFYREARAVAALNDPNIIRVFDVDRFGPNPFMVMEYADGTNLHEIVSKHGPLMPNRAADYIRQAALGLQHAFEVGLVHRDIKPGNLLLDRTGTVKVLDLGLARFILDPHRNQGITEKYDKHIVIGTVDFMAPEQAFDTAAVDVRSDIYGLGCSLYYLLTGRVPFPDRSVPEKMYSHKTRAPAPVSEICPRAPGELLEVLERMMAKEPADRFQTPAEVVEALAESVMEMLPPPPAHEMPEHPSAFYRLGLSPTPDVSSALAVTPNPTSQVETLPAPPPADWELPGPSTPAPKPAVRPPSSTDDPSFVLAAPPPKSGKRFRSGRMRRRLVRLGELALFLIAAGFVGWAMSRKGGSDVPAQSGTPPAVAPKEPTTPFAGTIVQGGGAAFASPILHRWASVYEKSHGVRIDYRDIGADSGVQAAVDRVYLFGCTPTPLTDEQLAEIRSRGKDVVHIPLAMGAVAVAYNLPDVNETVRFTGPVLADVYLGKITRWDDRALIACNPGVAMPDLPIAVIYHGEPTGTSFLWTDYLSRVSAEWRMKLGAKTDVAWPVGSPANGQHGTATAISRTVGAIGYLEQSHAVENNLRVGRVKNHEGKYQAPTPDGVAAAAAATLKSIPADLRFSLVNAPGEDAYPIVGAVWAIVQADLTSSSAAKDLIAFLRWATHEGQAYVGELKFAPLPPDLVRRIDERLDGVRVK
jgi:eukaryotic-like serine/threonine-protein kinase